MVVNKNALTNNQMNFTGTGQRMAGGIQNGKNPFYGQDYRIEHYKASRFSHYV